MNWQPQANPRALKARADTYEKIRLFFQNGKVLEVETPLLGVSTVTNPHIQSIATDASLILQTSPEYYMKRLLALNSGDIYQLNKVFRQGRNDKSHHVEFSLLQWYRLGFDQWNLMDEVSDLVEIILGVHHFEHLSYRDAFNHYLGINPWEADIDALKFEVQQHINIEIPRATKDDWLNLLMKHFIEPHLGLNAPVFIYDFPPTQAGFAKINTDESGFEVAEKFQLFYRGMVLAKGCHELTDAAQQKKRFHENNQRRIAMGLQPQAIDYALLKALEHGVPECAGVSLGIDRLLMLLLRTENIDDVLSFSEKGNVTTNHVERF